jgi:hypothetical protein
MQSAPSMPSSDPLGRPNPYSRAFPRPTASIGRELVGCKDEGSKVAASRRHLENWPEAVCTPAAGRNVASSDSLGRRDVHGRGSPLEPPPCVLYAHGRQSARVTFAFTAPMDATMPVANTPWRQVPLNYRLSLRYVKMFGRRAMSNELTLYFLALQSEAPAENLIRLLIHL